MTDAVLARAYWLASRGTEAPILAGDRGRDLYLADDFGEPGQIARRLARLAIYHRERSLNLPEAT